MTSPLQPAGVQAVVVNLNGFLSGLGQMNAGMQQTANISVNVTQQLNASGQAFANLGKTFNVASTAAAGVTGGISAIGSVVGGVGSSVIGFFSNFLSTLTAFITRDVLGFIVRGMRDMLAVAGQAAVSIQVLTIRLDNLIARQVRLSDETVTQADSMKIASGATQELLDWMRQLALTTPFSIDTISDTASFALAMGWGIQPTKDLTKAILDFSAGMGLGNNEMDRIIYNFAQMRAAGKVTGTEMRDLARGAFFPLTEVLDVAAKKLGISAEGLTEFRKAAAEGAIDVETFFQAFIEVAGKNFPDAANKMNVTFKAVKDNLEDFFKIMLGWNAFGPVVARFSEILSNALKGLTTPEVTQEFQILGQALLGFFNALIDAGTQVKTALQPIFEALGLTFPTLTGIIRSVSSALVSLTNIVKSLGSGISNFISQYILPFAQGLRDQMGGSIQDVANRALAWGAKIVQNLAEGIIRGAGAALTAAMNFITSLFTDWLSPGSPPKVAPDIQSWGAKTFAEYLRGFSMADFSMLDSVQNALKGALDALVNLGDLGKEAGDKLFVGLSKDIIKAIAQFNKTGEMSDEIFQKLSKVGGGFGAELADLFKKQVALAKATEAAAKAEKELKAAQDDTKLHTANVNKLVKEYNALLRAGADKKALKEKLKAVNAEEEQLDAARKREKEAELANEAAQKALDPLKEAVKLQEELIQQLIELAKAQAEAEKPPGDGGGGGGGGGGEKPKDIFDAIEKGFNDLWEKIKQDMIDKLGGIWDTLLDWWMKTIQPWIDKLLALWNNLITAIGKWLENMYEKYWKPIWEKVVFIVTWAWNIVSGVISLVLKTIDSNIQFWTKFWEGWWQRHGEAVVGIVSWAWNLMWTVISATLNLILDQILIFIAWVEQWWAQNGTKLITLWNITWTAINLILADFLEIIGLALDAFYAITQGDWKAFGDRLVSIANQTWKLIEDILKLSYLFMIISTELFASLFKSIWNSTWEAVLAKVEAIWVLLVGAVGTKLSELYTLITTIISAILKWIGEQKENWINAGSDLIRGLIDGIVAKIKDLVTATAGAALMAIASAKKALGIGSPSTVFAGIGADMMQGLINGVLTKIPAVAAAIIQAIKDGIAAALGALGMKSPSKVYMGIGQKMMTSMALGITEGARFPQMAAAMAAQSTIVPAQQVMRQSSVTFGDTYVNNAMDGELFVARVKAIVQNEL